MNWGSISLFVASSGSLTAVMKFDLWKIDGRLLWDTPSILFWVCRSLGVIPPGWLTMLAREAPVGARDLGVLEEFSNEETLAWLREAAFLPEKPPAFL